MSLTKQEKQDRIDIVDDCGGIIPYFETFYIQSIRHSGERAMEAFLRYQGCLASNANPISAVSTIHEALGHAAALSRFFWPARNNRLHILRAEKLRDAFVVDEHSALKNRSIRNTLEHFDERLDEYLLLNEAGHFFPTAILDKHQLADEPTAKIFKLVDPDEQIFVILNEKFDFSGIRNEIARILELAEKYDKNGSRLK